MDPQEFGGRDPGWAAASQENKYTLTYTFSTICIFQSMFYSHEEITVKFNIHRSVHLNNILQYKSQLDAHGTEFI
jgi:hypothetical protein